MFADITDLSQIWMSHSDSISELPEGFEITATTDSIPVAAFCYKTHDSRPVYGLQFHPEVYHSTEGKKNSEKFSGYGLPLQPELDARFVCAGNH